MEGGCKRNEAFRSLPVCALFWMASKRRVLACACADAGGKVCLQRTCAVHVVKLMCGRKRWSVTRKEGVRRTGAVDASTGR